MNSIRSWIDVVAIVAALTSMVLSTRRPFTDLGNGFTAEAVRNVTIRDAGRPIRHVWLTHPNGTRTQLSEFPVDKNAILRTNSIVVWQEMRVIARGAFDVYYAPYIFAADTTGRRAELTGWLKERAGTVLPTASPESLLAIPAGATGQPGAPTHDPRAGILSFTPDSLQFASWRPDITVWCSVPGGGPFRPLAMQVPADEIASYLRQQTVASNR